ncbi:MAG: hypothetical protein AB7S72_11405 [Draconibacterium sp.]|jgi:hypothetical protein
MQNLALATFPENEKTFENMGLKPGFFDDSDRWLKPTEIKHPK